MEEGDRLCEEIKKVAYELYERRGMTHGADLEDWLQAERLVMAKYSEKLKSKEDSKASKKERASKRKTY
ncbi:MAG: DUF2934 domain-containing protein [Nitrospirae bacterium]|nr:DUF2934 domain-containing protein [Nitrospirota bacterium]